MAVVSVGQTHMHYVSENGSVLTWGGKWQPEVLAGMLAEVLEEEEVREEEKVREDEEEVVLLLFLYQQDCFYRLVTTLTQTMN